MSSMPIQFQPCHPMWFYERNYRLLLELVPELKSLAQAERVIGHWQQGMKLRLLESCPYTQIVTISQDFTRQNPLLSDLRMTLRIYHDANLLEVIGYQDIRHLLAAYNSGYARTVRYDEKRQANVLLYEWLMVLGSSCRATGQIPACS